MCDITHNAMADYPPLVTLSDPVPLERDVIFEWPLKPGFHYPS